MGEESWDLTHTKERIAKVAVRLFSRKGFKGTTMKDIASEVGITEGAIYRHFASKEDIIRYLTKEITEELNRLIAVEVLPQKTFREKVARLVEVLMGYALTNPDKFRYLTVYHILREELSQEDLPGRRILEIFKTAYREGDTDLIPEIALSYSYRLCRQDLSY
ncbi:MAG: TetR/AcrR family transcriptional regulator [Aquificota bacterium]|nr:TetR/AcrR family transcriptional regulator [Aquificota bacterium]